MKITIWLFFTLLVVTNFQCVSGIELVDDAPVIISFSENILLSTDDSIYSHHVEPTMAISENGTIFTGWKDALTHSGPGYRVSFCRSTDNGETWSEPYNMPQFEGMDTRQSDPWLFWRSGAVYYAYMDFIGSWYTQETQNFSQITISKSTDYGKTWTPVKASYNSGLADKETMTVSNDGTVYLTYGDFIVAPNGTIVEVYIRLSSSTDGGTTYSEKSVIAEETAVFPFVTTSSNGSVYVALRVIPGEKWGDVYISYSNDNGLTFSELTDLNPESENATSDWGTGLSRQTMPVIRFDQDDRLYALWAERYEPLGEWDVYIRYSDDYGQTWSQRYRVNPDIEGMQWHPDLDFDSQGRCHIVYYDQRGDQYAPLYRMISFPKDSTGEVVFGDPIVIASDSTSAPYNRRPGEYFAVRIDSNDIPHVVWSDGRYEEMDIYYSQGLFEQETSSSTSTSSTSTSSASTSSTSTSSTSLGMYFPLILVILAYW
ncbi:MAG: sialidase family protein, partial [Candidatus Hodarchaeales archaeon]